MQKYTEQKCERQSRLCARIKQFFPICVFFFISHSVRRQRRHCRLASTCGLCPLSLLCSTRRCVCVCNRRSSSPIQEKIKLHNTYNKLKCDGTLSAPTQIIIHTKHHIILLYLGYARRCGVPARAHASIH